jgi:hypothetical protein
VDDEWMTAARAAGWLPAAEIEAQVWRARNLNGDRCRWCGVPRIGPQPRRSHRQSCRFYDGPLIHAVVNTYLGSFGYRITCNCGRTYPERGADGGEQQCPDRGMTWRRPQQPDLMPGDDGSEGRAATDAFFGSGAPDVHARTADNQLSLVSGLRKYLRWK